MASIDKTYAKTWKEYQVLVEWAKDKEFVCPNGMILYPSNYIYEHHKENWQENSAVMNTTQSLDYFLIKYCPLKFVQDRMNEVYNETYIDNIKNSKSIYDVYKRHNGTKIKIIKYPKFGNKGKLCEKKNRMKFITVDLSDDWMWYNKDYDYWISSNELGYFTSNMCHKRINSTKAMIRQIRKWKLPIGSIVTWSGRYIDNDFKFLVYGK